MPVFSSAIPPAQRLLADVLADERFREFVTYKVPSSTEAFDDDLGYSVAGETSYPLPAVRMRHTKKSVLAASSPVMVGDLLFVFSAEGFPAGASVKDRIVDKNGNVFSVKNIDPVFGIAKIVTVAGAS